MKCVKCESENICKNGLISEKQRYKCKNCGYNFTTGRPSKPLYLKRLALELYLEGLGFRSIGRILKVSNVAVLNWIKSFGQKVEELRKNDEISVVEPTVDADKWTKYTHLLVQKKRQMAMDFC